MTEPGSVLDLLPDGVVVADAAGLVTAVSTPAAAMLGVDAETAVGRPLGEVLALSDREGNDWVRCNDPYGGISTRSAIPEQSWLLPDGTEVLVTARLTRPGRAQAVSAVAVSLRSGRGRARLDRERSDLVATVAHELRSPLTGVKGFVHALLNRWEKLNDEQKRLMLTTVSTDADRLSRLIAELLDVARIDTGRLQVHPRPTDPVLKAQRAVEALTHATSRRITLVAEADEKIVADPDKITQVLLNLLENAIKHGEGEVTVRVAPDPADPSYVVISVTDQGEGIAPELRHRAFTKFWTGSRSGGSGLGLYIVTGLVRAHGGRVTIEDAPGGGTCVTTTWPVADRD